MVNFWSGFQIFVGDTIYYIKFDIRQTQIPDWADRWSPDESYPVPYPFLRVPRGLGYPNLALSKRWFDYFISINRPQYYKSILKPGLGITFLAPQPAIHVDDKGNFLYQDGMRKVAQIGSGMNLVIPEKRNGRVVIENDHVLIQTFKPQDSPPSAGIGYDYDPGFIHKAAAVRPRDGYVHNLKQIDTEYPKYTDAEEYFPLLCAGDAWLSMENLDVVTIPQEVTVTSEYGLNVRREPYIAEHYDQPRNVVDVLPYNRTVKVFSAIFKAGDIWFEIDKGFIAGAYQPVAGLPDVFHFTDFFGHSKGAPAPYFNASDPIPVPAMPFTNQDMINAFYEAFGLPGYWRMIEAAGFASLIFKRQEPYTGKVVSQLGLSETNWRKLQVAVVARLKELGIIK